MNNRIRSLSVVAACGLVLMAGCDWLRGGGPPDEASIKIESDDLNEITIVTSQFFLLVEDPECAGEVGCPTTVQLSTSDTTVVALPYATTIQFTSTYQLFVETYPVEEIEATVGMEISIDGEEWYNDFRRVLARNEEGDRDTLRFVYQFGGPNPEDLVR